MRLHTACADAMMTWRQTKNKRELKNKPAKSMLDNILLDLLAPAGTFVPQHKVVDSLTDSRLEAISLRSSHFVCAPPPFDASDRVTS